MGSLAAVARPEVRSAWATGAAEATPSVKVTFGRGPFRSPRNAELIPSPPAGKGVERSIYERIGALENGNRLPHRIADLERQVAELTRLVKALIAAVVALAEADAQRPEESRRKSPAKWLSART